MQFPLEFSLVAFAALLLGVATTISARAHERYYNGPSEAYSIYQAPDGSYDSLADYTRDVWGVPCGVTCTREAHERWIRSRAAPY